MYNTYDRYIRGFYSYKAQDIDIKAHYTVEYTMDSNVFDMMDTTMFDFSMLDKREFDYLEDAILFWNNLYYSEQVLYVMLFEQVLLDGEVVLEQEKQMTLETVLDEISRKTVKATEAEMQIYKEENEMLLAYLARFGITKEKVREEMATY